MWLWMSDVSKVGKTAKFKLVYSDWRGWFVTKQVTVPAPIMDALEKEPLLINSRKNQDKKIFFEYKPLLNISRTNFDLK